MDAGKCAEVLVIP